MRRRPFIVGVGGTPRSNSFTERVMRLALDKAAFLGAETEAFSANELCVPLYIPGQTERTPDARRLVDLLRRADGIVVASPAYHGCVSGLLKNALDYAEDLSGDARAYLEGRAIGCISTAAGWQAAVSTLNTLRSIAHALRGWPTPLGVAINTMDPAAAPDGVGVSARVEEQLGVLAAQVIDFSRAWDASRQNTAI